ncbi:MAG TPA: flagellar assembly protein FliW, partial [Bacillota bacterium]|nr:flagellar assembly protein FliW [Bacillota bacterium]
PGTITLPLGLLGFEAIKQYVLLASPEEAPFLWLQVAGEAGLSFLVVSPGVACADYAPELSAEDVAFLGLRTAEDAMMFNIVTLHADGRATVNLKGPVVVNRHTLVGKQVVPLNAGRYPTQHPLPVAA